MPTDTDATDVKTIADTPAKTFVQVVKAATAAPKKQLQQHTSTMAQATDHRATLLTVCQTNNNTWKNGANCTQCNQGITETAETDTIAVNRTKFASVFVTRFMQNLDQEVLQRYLQEKLKFDVKCEKIVTRISRFASFHITTECPDPKVFMEPDIWPDCAYVRWYYKPRKPRNLAAVVPPVAAAVPGTAAIHVAVTVHDATANNP